uniref:Uncharacterized protein n=1 Tax=Vespula pensylvanica TaxID=30213 RepID=A0A834NYD5_VESPE|nr:hypothetical protein H0235_009221 [Vespula pensylvanica]
MNSNGRKGTKGTPSTLEGTVNEIPRYEGNNRRRGDRRDIPGSRRANARASERSSSPRNERDTPMRNVHLEGTFRLLYIATHPAMVLPVKERGGEGAEEGEEEEQDDDDDDDDDDDEMDVR